YCLHVTLRAQLKPLAPGLTPRAVLDKLAAIQMLDVHFPTTDGRTLILSRFTEPNADQKLLLKHDRQPTGAYLFRDTTAVLGALRAKVPRPIEDWRIVVKGRYPAYVDWQTYQMIRSVIRDNRAEYQPSPCSLTTGACVSRTMPLNALCAASL